MMDAPLTFSPPKPKAAQPISMDRVVRIIDRLQSRYGRKFIELYESVPRDVLLQTWQRDLTGFSDQAIERGLDACKLRVFPPTLPEFLSLCADRIDPAQAFYEALENIRLRERGEHPIYSHPAIFWAAAKIGAFDMRNGVYGARGSAITGRWNAALEAELSKGAWPPIPKPAPMLAAPSITVEQRQKNRQRLSALLDILHIRSMPKD